MAAGTAGGRQDGMLHGMCSSRALQKPCACKSCKGCYLTTKALDRGLWKLIREFALAEYLTVCGPLEDPTVDAKKPV